MTQFQNPFQVLNSKAEEFILDESHRKLDLKNRIEKIIHSSEVVLFMKGNASYPQCGFSANTVQILNTFDRPFKTFDILKDPEIRQGLKEYSNWPTFPQLYINGTLIGGNDIVTELYQEGELQKMLAK